MPISFSLVTTWSPAKDGEPLGYGIELTNTGDTPVSDFQLGFSGPARIDPDATLENGTLVRRLSNHSLIAPPAGSGPRASLVVAKPLWKAAQADLQATLGPSAYAALHDALGTAIPRLD